MCGVRHGAAAWLCLAAALASLLAVAGPAEAQTVVQQAELVEGLTHERFEVRLRDGAVARGDILRFAETDSRFRLRPELGGDAVAGLEPMPAMSRRLRTDAAIAGVNGGYWLPRPQGAPNGLYVEDGELIAGQSQSRSGLPLARGMLGIHDDGTLVLDRLGVNVDLMLPSGELTRVDEVNRAPRVDDEYARAGELILYGSRYGAPIEVPGSSIAVVVDDLRLPSSGIATAKVRSVTGIASTAALSVAKDTNMLIAHGTARPRLYGLAVGDEISVQVTPLPLATEPSLWANLTAALPGGPLLVRDGSALSAVSWEQEAYSDDHLYGRHPRTALAVTGGGEVLLVTVDGRRKGHSAGMSLAELTAYLLDRGAVSALGLDGGGSTTMTVAGNIVNQPSEVDRSVANGLFVYWDTPPLTARDTAVHACPQDAVPEPAFVDIEGNVHEANIACMVWYGVTRGVTQTRYGPGAEVTRAQMASFVTRLLDLLARGGGRALPDAEAGTAFTDVGEKSVHGVAIGRLAAAGIVNGGPGGRPDSEYGPDLGVTRAQMASFIARAVAYSTGAQLPSGANVFADDAGGVHENNTNRLAAAGVVQGRFQGVYAPGDVVSRSSMASFVMRAVDHLVEQGRTAPPG